MTWSWLIYRALPTVTARSGRLEITLVLGALFIIYCFSHRLLSRKSGLAQQPGLTKARKAAVSKPDMAQKFVHKGCGKVFTDAEEPCVYHPGPPVFHEGQKGGWTFVYDIGRSSDTW